VESAVPIVAVERGHLVGVVRADDIQPAISVVVGNAHAHARQSHAVLVKAQPAGTPISRKVPS
jgi:hypothetical protein